MSDAFGSTPGALATEDVTARSQYTVFAFLLAAAVLFHQARLGDWTVPFPDAALSLSALAVLVRPSSIARLLVLLALELVAVAIDMPAVVNHSLLIALNALAILFAVGIALVRRAAWVGDRGALYRQIAPLLRIAVILVYLFAGLAKLNASFLDPALSCAVAMSQDLLAPMPGALYAQWQAGPAIWGTIAVELLLPLLLVVRRTRLAAVFLGVGFHTVLAVAGHVPFSGFAMAFYWLFVPDDMPTRLRRLVERRERLRTAERAIGRIGASRAALPVLAGSWLLTGALVAVGPDRVLGAIHSGTNALFLVYVAALFSLLVLGLREGRSFTYRPGAFRLAHPAWLLAVLLLVVNGLAPYLGLKTQSTFTMYSNLQTEQGFWNHALIPREVRVFGFEDEPVRVIASSDPALAAAAREGVALAWLDFRALTSSRPDAAVSYERGGQRVNVARAGESAALSRPPGLLAGKLLAFRDIPPPERNGCRSRRRYTPAQGS